ncbi:response regulator [Marinagarivorans algicola]|uniref:response regulator n=1 Tax=Marinagarivorans algicola TaxID=1513270 RepID=UPI0037370E82
MPIIAKKRPKKAQDIRDNYPLRTGVMTVVLLINLSVLWGEGIVPAWYWVLVFAHTLLMPHIIYYVSSQRDHESYSLTFDVTMYAFYLGAWGYNPFLAAVFIATSNLTLISLGGWYRLLISLVMQLIGGLAGGLVTGFYFRPHLDITPMLIATVGFFIFMIGIGWLMHHIHQRLHTTRRDLKARHSQLADINTLAMAVNSQLTIDSIMEQLLNTLEKIYPFEAVYFLSYHDDTHRLALSGVYGEAISYEERTAFEALDFDLTDDANSVFIMGLVQRRIINLSHVEPAMVNAGAAIDKQLYEIKPCVSIIYFPIYIDDEVVGGLAFINHKDPCVLKKPDLQRISDYLIQVGTAIKNANLIRQLKKTREDALAAQKKAEESEEAKSRFLANMSHEIRTPMTAILGYSEALQDPSITEPERKEFIGIIMNSGKHLLSMINNILDISKIEASKVYLEKITIDVVHVMSDIERYIKLQADEKKLDYNLVIHYPVPKYITNDPTRLKQVLLNLCNNAIKFTDEGCITLTLSWPQSHLIEIKVQDTGIGMTEQECEHIFEAFTQADTSTTRLYGGTGLGLTISKSLALLMGGDLKVESEKNKGSQFVLTLDTGQRVGEYIDNSQAWEKLQKSQYHKHKKYKVPALKGRVLIAEDNPVNQQIIKRLVQLTGLAVDLVENGLEAVSAVSDNLYDLIFLDMQMPIMGGEDAALKIKALGVDTPMIAFTANVMTHQIQSYFDNGFIGVIEKPIDREKLYQLLEQSLPTSKVQVMNILIVSDHAVHAARLNRQIKNIQHGCNIMLAESKQETLNVIASTSVDLIFMDIQHAAIDGVELTQLLRKESCLVPIYLLVSHVDHESRYIAAGATGYLARPLNKHDLIKVLEAY